MTIDDKVIKRRNRPKTIQDILNAVETMFEERGVQKTNLSNIANKASINKQLIYRYFRNWNSLVLVYYQQFWNRVFAQSPTRQPLDVINCYYQELGLSKGILALLQWQQLNPHTELARQLDLQVEQVIKQLFANQQDPDRFQEVRFRFILGGIVHQRQNPKEGITKEQMQQIILEGMGQWLGLRTPLARKERITN